MLRSVGKRTRTDSISVRGVIVFPPPVNQPLEADTYTQKNQPGWQRELLFSDLSDVPAEEAVVKVCICLGMFGILIVLYTSAEMEYLTFLKRQLCFFLFFP